LAQDLARLFERDDEIVEGRLGRVRQDRFVLGLHLGHAGVERLRKLVGLIGVPLGHAVIRTGPFDKHGIGGHRLGGLGHGVERGVGAAVYGRASGKQRASGEQRKGVFHGLSCPVG
jgi:hypothetical protein